MTLLPVRRVDVDVAIVGSGFAGSLAALALAASGQRVALVERGRHPRFAIGESSTPLANHLLEQFADRYALSRIRPFSKWGTWQRERPDIAGGLKRGFSFFFHEEGKRFHDDGEHARQLLVGASPNDEVGDTHWYRPDFDANLAAEVEAAGCTYLDETAIVGWVPGAARVVLEGERHGQSLRVSAKFVIDASGPRGFLHRALGLPSAEPAWLTPTQGLYTHFEGVELWDEQLPASDSPPFPPDAAALHHVFPGGWIWVLRFNNGITSAGAALTDPLAKAIAAADGAAAWRQLLSRLPSIDGQFARARPTRPFVHAARLAFRSQQVYGARWAMLPSAAGVIDPLLSSGFPLTLLGLARLIRILTTTREGDEQTRQLQEYERATLAELDATEQLVAALYASMDEAPLFKRLSLLYFAAASYSEAACRLGRADLAPGFLLCGVPHFAQGFRAAVDRARRRERPIPSELLRSIDRTIEPFDVAGLLEPSGDWYPVRAEDLFNAARKLRATPDEIQSMLERCGFAPTVSRPAAQSAPR